MLALQGAGLGVRTTTSQISSQLANDVADVDCRERSLRYHYRCLHDLLCGFPKHSLSCLRRALKSPCSLWQLSRHDTTLKQTKIILKKIIRLTIETGSLTGTLSAFQSSIYVAKYIHSAIIGIVCFLLVALPDSPYYYQFPMGIIGKVYANSMLVLINSRMLLGSEDTPTTNHTDLRFYPAPADNKDPAMETHGGVLAVDTEAGETVDKFKASG